MGNFKRHWKTMIGPGVGTKDAESIHLYQFICINVQILLCGTLGYRVRVLDRSSCETGLCKPTAVPVKAKTSNQNIQVSRIHVPVVRMQV